MTKSLFLSKKILKSTLSLFFFFLIFSSPLLSDDDVCLGETTDDTSSKTDKPEEEKKSDEDKSDDKDSEEGKKDDKDKSDDKEESKYLKIGNLALPNSQQPGPLVGLGENIIDEGQSQVFLFFDDFLGRKKFFIDVVPGYLYGITDDFSVFFNLPYAPKYGDGPFYAAGFEDFFAQFEYAYYTDEQLCYLDQGTVLLSFFIPSGSIKKIPATGFGPLVFFGTTFSRTAVDWFGFTSYGAIITKSCCGTRVGNNYFYEGGFGRNIWYITDEAILSWMVEINGLYTERNRDQYRLNPDSGGNVIYVNPSLWYSTKDLIVQVGGGYAVIQNLNGRQNKEGFFLAFNLGWTL